MKEVEAAGASLIELDVTSPLETLESAAAAAVKIHGRVDVLVNNAAYIEIGALEEITPENTLKQFKYVSIIHLYYIFSCSCL